MYIIYGERSLPERKPWSFVPDFVLKERYQIIRSLGHGGMGAVYLAHDTVLDHVVAVKANHSPAEEAEEQFLKEARLLAALRHPTLPRVTDYFIIGEEQYLVMDYIPGESFDVILKEDGIQPVEMVMQWAQQLGSAISYLHHQKPPVIHRDIKPANIKLMPTGEVTLVDFGIAKIADGTNATTAGAQGFTPGYSPPEQYGGAHTGPYSDQYSLAATLYQLLTNHQPEDGLQRLMGTAVLAPMNILNPKVPEGMQAVIERAMSPKPEERYPSVDAFLKALTPYTSQTLMVKPEYERPGKGSSPPPGQSSASGRKTTPEVPLVGAGDRWRGADRADRRRHRAAGRREDGCANPRWRFRGYAGHLRGSHAHPGGGRGETAGNSRANRAGNCCGGCAHRTRANNGAADDRPQPGGEGRLYCLYQQQGQRQDLPGLADEGGAG